MKIIKLTEKTEDINSSLEILKNRNLSFQELDTDFNIINSLNKTKVVKVVESSKTGKLNKKINKQIRLHQEQGFELMDIKQSSHGYGNYGSETYLITLIFQ
ncbi:hypothetical protein [uncultured Winogradskyella sp.]|uniref:hypothetical protein n=1 Tax=uncultured Winogradskyella sp. TaxID=395353 RepID=UPI002629DB30|nr:hypothetical protein [uncultured Winogradskyella sp.]